MFFATFWITISCRLAEEYIVASPTAIPITLLTELATVVLPILLALPTAVLLVVDQ